MTRDSRMGRVVALVNQKGGAAKTTTCAAMADVLHSMGKRVLCVDVDPQEGNLTLVLQAERDELNGTAELLDAVMDKRNVDPEDYIQHLERCDAVAASSALIGTIVRLSGAIGREQKLARALAPMRGSYDFILVDTPGNLEILTINALVAADDVIVPTTADLCSTSGAKAVFDAISMVREECNPRLRTAGVLVANYRSSTNLHREFASTIAALCRSEGVRLFDTRIRQSIKASEGMSFGTPLGELYGSSTVARGIVGDYRDFVAEYLTTL